MVIVAPLCILFNISYYIINKNREDQTTHNGYTEIENTDTDNDEDDWEMTDDESQEKSKRRQAAKTGGHVSLSRKEKLVTIAKMLSLTFVPVFTTYVSYFTFIQSVTTTIAYKSAPFRPRDHYQYYIFIFMFGEMIGRSHRSVISFINSRWLYVPTCKQLWAFSFLVFLILLFTVFESWYRFLPGVATVFVLCLLGGFLGGLLFNNFPEILRSRFTERQREFGMGFALSPVSTGIMGAGIIGLFVEPRLLEHCVSTVIDSAYCFTRPESVEEITTQCGT
jgi:hypothetical protein